jgi:Zn-dependent M28 family amino/carboxypeptidase
MNRAVAIPILIVLTILTVLTFLISGCGSKPTPEIQWKAFDGQKAYEHVRQFVGFGPHPSGSPALTHTADYITTQLRAAGLDVEEQVFTAPTPRGPVQFRNIIGKTRGSRGAADQIVVFGSHYDTKWMTNFVFVGANDGGSSTGVLLEMARVASAQPNVWFVFFDGEEAMVEYGANDGFWGSRQFVKDLQDKNRVNSVKAMVLLDMVGDANLNVTMPSDSTSALVQRVFQAAKDAGHRDYFGYRNSAILDDHVPFLEAGIPAVDLIDFEYGSAPGLNDYWHTDKDTLDKISPRSLEIVGQTTLRLLALLQQSPSLR